MDEDAGDSLPMVATTETVKQAFFLELALSATSTSAGSGGSSSAAAASPQQHQPPRPLGILGPSGTGKSFVTNSFIRRLSKERFVTNVVNFSARTSVTYTQDVVMSR